MYGNREAGGDLVVHEEDETKDVNNNVEIVEVSKESEVVSMSVPSPTSSLLRLPSPLLLAF